MRRARATDGSGGRGGNPFACRSWQTFDIVFEAPRFRGTAVLAPAYFTVFWNGAVVHNRQPVAGPTALLTVHQYTAHEAELPLSIQGRAPVRFRNIWIRRIKGYDQPEG
jgi:hypothetical protein